MSRLLKESFNRKNSPTLSVSPFVFVIVAPMTIGVQCPLANEYTIQQNRVWTRVFVLVPGTTSKKCFQKANLVIRLVIQSLLTHPNQVASYVNLVIQE